MKKFNDKNQESGNRGAGLVKYLVMFLVILLVIYGIFQVSRFKTSQYFFKVIGENITTFAVNGSESNVTAYGRFIEVNTSATSISITVNKTSLVLSLSFLRSTTLPGLNYSYINLAPEITPNGFNGTIIIRLFSASLTIGLGNNFVMIYANAHNFAVYTNGVDYVLENSTWDVYGFTYANSSSLRLMYSAFLYPNLSDVAVPEKFVSIPYSVSSISSVSSNKSFFALCSWRYLVLYRKRPF